MALAFYKCVFVYENTRDKVGWTHSIWVQAADASSAATSVGPYWDKLRVCLMDYVFLRGIRISNVDPPRDSRLFGAPVSPDNHGTVPAATVPSVGYTEALLCRRDRAAGDLIGNIFVHGVPLAIFDGRDFNGGALPAGWDAAFGALQAAFLDNAWLMKKRIDADTVDYLGTPNLTAQYMTSRRVGRPFDRIRGRRRTA